MNNRFACLIAAGLALAAAPHTVMFASPDHHSVGDVDILVDGVSQSRYAHNGRWYVEARKGREYAIRLRNPYASRVAVALSCATPQFACFSQLGNTAYQTATRKSVQNRN